MKISTFYDNLLQWTIFILQNEIENLKQAIADLEEKVQYQSDERLRDVYEIMENCQTRVSKLINYLFSI